MLSFIQRHFLLPIGAFIWVVPFTFLVSIIVIIVVIFAICIFNLELIQCFLFSQRHHHLVKAHSTTTLICDECSMTFVDKNDLKKHKKGVIIKFYIYQTTCKCGPMLHAWRTGKEEGTGWENSILYQNLFSIMPSIQRRHPIAFGLQKVTSLSYCNIGLSK